MKTINEIERFSLTEMTITEKTETCGGGWLGWLAGYITGTFWRDQGVGVTNSHLYL